MCTYQLTGPRKERRIPPGERGGGGPSTAQRFWKLAAPRSFVTIFAIPADQFVSLFDPRLKPAIAMNRILKTASLAMAAFAVSGVPAFSEAATGLAPGTFINPNLVNPIAAGTPPMGWNSWNAFGCDISESKILANLDLMIARGYREAGYIYMNIDDCWMADNRDANTGELVPHPTRFPRGIKFIADYVHARGMKLGIYSSAGTGTCEKRPASLYHEDVDARTFARWGIDLLKYDNCNNDNLEPRGRFTTMSQALRRATAGTNRSIVYAMCAWGDYKEWTWAWSIADYWRTTPDICQSWSGDCGWKWPVTRIIDLVATLQAYQGPRKGWNDADMLQAGNAGLTRSESIAHFVMWAALKSPLIVGTDLRVVDPVLESVILNKEIIAVNQDPKGKAVTKVWQSRNDGLGYEIYAGPLVYTGTKKSCVVGGLIEGVEDVFEPTFMNLTFPSLPFHAQSS